MKEVRVYVKVKTPIRSGTRHSWPSRLVHDFRVAEENLSQFCTDLSKFIHENELVKAIKI